MWRGDKGLPEPVSLLSASGTPAASAASCALSAHTPESLTPTPLPPQPRTDNEFGVEGAGQLVSSALFTPGLYSLDKSQGEA